VNCVSAIRGVGARGCAARAPASARKQPRDQWPANWACSIPACGTLSIICWNRKTTAHVPIASASARARELFLGCGVINRARSILACGTLSIICWNRKTTAHVPIASAPARARDLFLGSGVINRARSILACLISRPD